MEATGAVLPGIAYKQLFFEVLVKALAQTIRITSMVAARRRSPPAVSP